MIDQGQALLRAICENPRDDFVRLAYADWLEEEGQGEWSEFIRIGVELSQFPEEYEVCLELLWILERYRGKFPNFLTKKLDTKGVDVASVERFLHLHRREREILECVLPKDKNDSLFFLWEYSRTTDRRIFNGWNSSNGLLVRRGFISEIHCTLKGWYGEHGEGHGPAIVAQQPIERVTLVDREPRQTVAGIYFWERIRSAAKLSQEIYPRFLPGSIFDLLKGFCYCSEGEIRVKNYSDKQSAANALSQACINWARHEAGLPLLT